MVVEKLIYKDNEISELYFNRPVQVEFEYKEEPPTSKIYGFGIAYCDEIIDAKSGIIISLDEIARIELLPWKSILFKY